MQVGGVTGGMCEDAGRHHSDKGEEASIVLYRRTRPVTKWLVPPPPPP